MKVISALLLVIFFVNNSLYYACFNVELIEAKLSARLAVSANESNGNFLKIPVDSLTDDEDEIWYGGILYDIIKRETVKDTIYIYVLQDEKEQSLLTSLWNYYRSEISAGISGADKISSLKYIHFPDQQSITDKFELVVFDNSRSIINPTAKVSACSVIVDIFSPPPESIYL